jgi:hypothetical protein
MDHESETGIEARRLSRRTALKGAAAGAGVVFVAPVITSFETKAAAQSLQATCGTKYVCGNVANCGPGLTCLCTMTIEGYLFCSNDFTCGTTKTCTKSSDCPSGWMCQAAGSGCCGAGVCLPPCGTEAEVRTAATSGSGGKKNSG